MARATLKDIAEATGLSTTTVSIILNNKAPHISGATKQAVLEAAKRLNYRPNSIARSLATNRSMSLGMILPDIANPFFAELAKGAEAACSERRYHLFLCNSNDRPEKDIEHMQLLADRGVDGIVLASSAELSGKKYKASFEAIRQQDKALVLLDRATDDTQITSVGLDHKLGGYLATKHLIDRGHRRIGCITGPPRLRTARNRFEGYKNALAEAGIAYDEALVRHGDYHQESGYELCGGILQQGITALFAANDLMAVGVIKRTRELGVRIPQQLSLVGFDDMPFSQMIDPALTTIHQPAYDMGFRALQLAIDMVERPNAAQANTVFKPGLVVRGSVAAQAQA